MSPRVDANMRALKRLWTKIARFVEALEGIDDPTGHDTSSLAKRIDKLERDVEHLERRLRSCAGGGIQQ
jgi:hypothetical protein